MKKLKFLEKSLNNKQFMMLFSIVAAVLFWFFVVAQISPNSTRTIRGVPITINEKGGFISNAGLHVVEESLSKISIDVTGPRYIIGRLGSSDFVITPDTGPVNKSGEFTLTLVPQMKKPNPKVSISNISQRSIKVKFDTVVSESFPIEVKLINNSKIADGYIMESAAVSPQNVAVTGPSAEVGQVARAVTNVQINNNITSTMTVKSNILLYDSKNNLLDLKHIKTDYLTASVTVPILKTKQQPLSVDFLNLPAGFDKNNIKYSVNPANITVAGAESDISALSSMKLQSIDFSTLDISNTINDDLVMPDGITNVDNITSAVVTVNLLNTGTKTISTKNFNVINTPSGYTVKVRTTQINNIKIFGPSADIGSLSAVTATIDMSSFNVIEGTYEVPVTISVPGKSGYWITGKYTATINAWKN